jgi:cation:H+ antiporter
MARRPPCRAEADALEARTGAGEALIGMLLLGFITALPELAVTVTASAAGNAPLAVNNLLGGMSLNVALLAASDAAVRRGALGVGAWTAAIGAGYLACLWLVKRTQGRRPRVANEAAASGEPGEARHERRGVRRILGSIALGALFILAAGHLLARSGDAIAEQTGLGADFFGAAFLALATSLPISSGSPCFSWPMQRTTGLRC